MNTQRKLIAVMSMCAAVAIPNIAFAVTIPVSGQGTWETTLQGRDLDNNLATIEAYYDTVLNMTWLADASYDYGSSYDRADGTTDGQMTWANAMAWSANLNPYGSGITGWRLPTTFPIDGTTADDAEISYIGTEDRGSNISAPGTLYAGSTASEMAHLYYNTLGNKAYCDPTTSTVSSCNGPQASSGLTNTGPFSNIQLNNYWSATEFAPGSDYVFFFDFDNGIQTAYRKAYPTNGPHAWAVHTGDVGIAVPSAVPVPAAAWLLGSGLLGLIGVARKAGAIAGR